MWIQEDSEWLKDLQGIEIIYRIFMEKGAEYTAQNV